MKKKEHNYSAPTEVKASLFVFSTDMDIIKDGYFRIGMLSTAFAAMEQGVQDLLFEITRMSDSAGFYLIQGNNLHKNLQLLEEINKYRKYEPEKIKTLVKSIINVKTHRNNLLHGTWNVLVETKTKEGLVQVIKPKMSIGTLGSGYYLKKKESYSYHYADLDKHRVEIENINSKLANLIIKCNL